jgi:HEAT repeat protein
MSALHRSLAAAALIATALATPAGAADPKLPRDGWVSWDVPAVDNAPAWCCLDWKDREGVPVTCQLDGRSNGFSSRHRETTDTVTVYARTAGGKLDRLRVFDAACPVEAKTPIAELTDVTADDSARWLLAQMKSKPLTDDALAALAMHPGAFAHDSLVRLGDSDETAHVRSKAWFWLAMTGAPGVESSISSAIRRDPDGGVREEAVFALSLLPDDRATRALIALAEDRSLSREQRKRAVFWLSQSESTAALAYLDKVLTAATPARQ